MSWRLSIMLQRTEREDPRRRAMRKLEPIAA